MSLFGSLMRDMENDPIFGHHHRQMNRMVSSFFGGHHGNGGGMFDGGFGGNSLMGPPPPHMDSLMSFGGGFGNPFGGFGGNMFNPAAMMSDPNSHCFSSSSVMSVTAGPDGRPQVYQASSATRQAPGGLKETRKTVQDSRTGTKKMEVGRHLGERGHVREREENMYTGQREENEDYINLAEDEAEDFNQEWRQRASYAPNNVHGHGYLQHHSHTPNLAITSGELGPRYSEEPHPAYNHHHGRRQQGHRPSHSEVHPSASAVTIEELPPSDNEAEVEEKQPTTSRLSFPSIPRVSRRSPHSKERRQKSATSKRSKKY